MFSKKILVRTIVALAVLLVPAAFAQVTKTATGTMTGSTSLTDGATTSAPSFTLTTDGVADTDATTVLEYASNDGGIHDIKVEITPVATTTNAWAFTPTTTGNTTNSYPVLSFDSAALSAQDGTGAATGAKGALNTTANAVNTAIKAVETIQNESGTATITLSATADSGVSAGTYEATVKFSIVARP